VLGISVKVVSHFVLSIKRRNWRPNFSRFTASCDSRGCKRAARRYPDHHQFSDALRHSKQE
jgi:hypothetical protein